MILSAEAIKLITVQCKNLLALNLKCSAFTIGRLIRTNKPNGDLTKAIAVKTISEETGLPQEEILVESTVDATVKESAS